MVVTKGDAGTLAGGDEAPLGIRLETLTCHSFYVLLFWSWWHSRLD